jgi:hypothetical protein
MNTEYICSNEIKYLYSNNGYSVLDIRIYSEYMPNIQETHTEYAPNIYSSSQFDRIRISIIFVGKKKNIHIRLSFMHHLCLHYLERPSNLYTFLLKLSSGLDKPSLAFLVLLLHTYLPCTAETICSSVIQY